VPDEGEKRKKFFLEEGSRKEWVWEAGRVYQGDFFNPYLDFNAFALKLPGFSLSILGYLDGKDSLRYVLKNKATDEVFFVVVFSLIPKDEIEKEEAASEKKSGEEKHEQEESKGEEGFEPKEDDLD